ncbi:MAG: hypothetical protein ACYTGQ_18295, partial [Planctomycetota bacterium]
DADGPAELALVPFGEGGGGLVADLLVVRRDDDELSPFHATPRRTVLVITRVTIPLSRRRPEHGQRQHSDEQQAHNELCRGGFHGSNLAVFSWGV